MKVFTRLLLAVFFISIMSISSFALDVPVLQGRVNDYAELLTQAQRGKLENALRDLEDETTVQVAILTVKDLQGYGIEPYSLEVAETWGLGQKEKDNGLLILYAVEEDIYRVEVGYGLEGAIPDGKAGDIIRNELRSKADPTKGLVDFNGAFSDATRKISDIVLAEYVKDPTGKSMRKSSNSGDEVVVFLFFVFVAVMVAGVFGIMNGALGAIIGGLEGLGVAWICSFGTLGLIIFAIVGIFVGIVAKFIIEAIASSGGGGGYSSGLGGSSSSSSGGGFGDFGGGGGSFGGGGASG